MKSKLISIFMTMLMIAAYIPAGAADMDELSDTDVIIAAAYDHDGRLAAVKSGSVNEAPDVGTGYDSVKLFRWRDLEGCMPAADSEVIKPDGVPTYAPTDMPTVPPQQTSVPTSTPASTSLPEPSSEPTREPTSEPTESPTPEPGVFTDMPDGETGAALQKAVDEGILFGYEDGTIRPDASVTRADMADIAVRLMGVNENSKPAISDIAEDAWYREAAEKAVTIGVMSADASGGFEPERSVTCEECYEIFAKLLQFESYELRYLSGKVAYATKADPAVLDAFSDRASVSSGAVDYAAAVVGNGGFGGFDGLLKGGSDITRGELAILLNDLIGTYIDEPGTYTNADIDSSRSVLVRSGGVVLDGAVIDRNLIVAYSVDESGFKAVNVDIGLVAAVMGGADPKKDIKNLTSYVSIGGRVRDARVCAPYIYLDLSGAVMAKTDYIRTCKNSKANLGFSGG